MGSDFFKNSIFIHPKNISLIEAEFSLQSSLFSPSQSQLWLGGALTAVTPATLESFSYSPQSFGDCFAGSYSILFKLLPAILSITGALSAIILYHLPLLNLINRHPSPLGLYWLLLALPALVKTLLFIVTLLTAVSLTTPSPSETPFGVREREMERCYPLWSLRTLTIK